MSTITLSQAIEAHGENLKEITLRPPTVGDIKQIGMPFDINPEGLVVANARVVSAYISRLGNIPPMSVDKLAVCDWMALWGDVMSFFGQSRETLMT